MAEGKKYTLYLLPPASCPLPLFGHGQAEGLLRTSQTIEFKGFSDEVRKTLTTVHNYLFTHQSHINYQHYKELGSTARLDGRKRL